MKQKTKKSEREKILEFGLIVLAVSVLMFLFLILSVLATDQLVQERTKSEACENLLSFTSEYFSYLNSQPNFNLNESLDDFVRYKMEELLKE